MKQFIHKKPVNLITGDSFDDNEGSYFDTFNKEQSEYKEFYDKVEGPAKEFENKLEPIYEYFCHYRDEEERAKKLNEWKRELMSKDFWILINDSFRYLASIYRMANNDDPVVAPLEITKQKRKTRIEMPRSFMEITEFADDVRALLIFLGEGMRWVKGLAVTDVPLFKQVKDMYNGDTTWITTKAIPGKMYQFIYYLVRIFKYVNEALPPSSVPYDTNAVSNWVDRSAFKHINAVRVSANGNWNNGYAFGGIVRYKDNFLKPWFSQFGDASWLDWLAEPIKKENDKN